MLTAKDIMTRDVITATPDMSVRDLADLLWKNRISGVPVINSDGELVSVVTESDLIDQTKKVHVPKMIAVLDAVLYLERPDKLEKDIKKMTGATVRDIMASELVTVTADEPLDEIATIVSEKNTHTLPVVAGKKLIGVIGKSDIIRSQLP
jgi:CBS-domain-containing membrane protein